MSNPNGFTWESWDDTENEALASQRRGESEDLHAERMREIEEIGDGMDVVNDWFKQKLMREEEK